MCPSATLSYTYDALNRIKSVTTPRTISSGAVRYDALGNVVKLTPLQNGSNNFLGLQTYAYDAMDRRTSLAYPNGVSTSYGYDNAYRITSIATKNKQGNIIDAWSYQYDAVGNRTAKTDMDWKVESYAYDNTYASPRLATGTERARRSPTTRLATE